MFKKNNKTFIEFKKVNFGYEPKKMILKDISFSLNEKEHVCIIGSNGCGKSTLAKLMVGLFKPHTGFIVFKNRIISKSNVSNLKQTSGIVFENPDNQFVGLTVQDEIAFGLENKCVPRQKMQSIINRVAKFVGITDILTSSTNSLSGGQKQLVALASVLAMDPSLIVFDEANAMLDYKSRTKINRLISLLKKKKTIITITHNMDDAAKADRLIVMSKGKIVAFDKPHQIFSDSKYNKVLLDKPFVYKLAEKLKSKQHLLKGINYEK